MKKILIMILVICTCFAFTVFADEVKPVIVTLNGEVVDCASYGQEATIIEGRTMVPLRAIFESLGATVEWDATTRTVHSRLGETEISLTVGENKLIKNGQEIALDVPAQIVNDRTLVPVRAVSESFGVFVEWISELRIVVLTYSEGYERGIVDGNKYTSEWLGLEVVLPENSEFRQEDHQKELIEKTEDILGVETDEDYQISILEFTAVIDTHSVVLFSEAVEKDESIEDFITYASSSTYEAMGVVYTMGERYSAKIAGVDFECVDSYINMYGVEYYTTTAVLERDGRYVGLLLSYNNPEELKKALSCFKPLSGEGVTDYEKIGFEMPTDSGISLEEMFYELDKVQPKSDLDNEILLTVGGVDISASMVRCMVFSSLQNGEEISADELKENELDFYRTTAFYANEFEKLGFAFEREELESMKENIDYLKAMYADEYDLVFASSLYTPYFYCSYAYIYDVAGSKLFEYMLENDDMRAKVLDSAVNIAENNEYVRIKHILVMFENDDEKEAALAKANEVLALVNANPEKFDDYVKQYGEDPGMEAYPGGYVFTYGEMVESFEDKAFELKEGETSGIVETFYGYHILLKLPIDAEGVEETSLLWSDVFYEAANDVFFNEFAKGRYDYEIVYSDNYDKRVVEFKKEYEEIMK